MQRLPLRDGFLLCLGAACLLLLGACQSGDTEQESPVDNSIESRVARIQQAIDAEFKAQREGSGASSDLKLGQLSQAQGRLSQAEVMALGATVTQDAAALQRVDNELRQLEAEFGITN